MHPIHPVGPKLMFGCILDSFVTARSLVQNGLNWCYHKVASEFFATNAPNPPHWILNSCLCASRSVWVYLAIFHYSTKLSAKRVEPVQLMHKFVPWNRIGIFAMNGPNPPRWALNSCFGASRSVWVHLAMFHYYTKLVAKWVELVQLMHKFVPWSRFGIFHNERTQSTPLDPKLMFVCIL